MFFKWDQVREEPKEDEKGKRHLQDETGVAP